MTLKQLAAERKLRMDAMGLLAGVDKGTISRIANGKTAARPETVVKLATAQGISAMRMQLICYASWAAAHPEKAAS